MHKHGLSPPSPIAPGTSKPPPGASQSPCGPQLSVDSGVLLSLPTGVLLSLYPGKPFSQSRQRARPKTQENRDTSVLGRLEAPCAHRYSSWHPQHSAVLPKHFQASLPHPCGPHVLLSTFTRFLTQAERPCGSDPMTWLSLEMKLEKSVFMLPVTIRTNQ